MSIILSAPSDGRLRVATARAWQRDVRTDGHLATLLWDQNLWRSYSNKRYETTKTAAASVHGSVIFPRNRIF